MAGKSITYYVQKRDLPEIKAELREEYQQIHSQILQDVLLRLKRAFDAFFKMPPSTFYGLEEPNAGQPT
jgi:putative transposase